jgi:hypothetical protein
VPKDESFLLEDDKKILSPSFRYPELSCAMLTRCMTLGIFWHILAAEIFKDNLSKSTSPWDGSRISPVEETGLRPKQVGSWTQGKDGKEWERIGKFWSFFPDLHSLQQRNLR